jgi:hypothetical protein
MKGTQEFNKKDGHRFLLNDLRNETLASWPRRWSAAVTTLLTSGLSVSRELLLPTAAQSLVDLDQSNKFVRLGLRHA